MNTTTWHKKNSSYEQTSTWPFFLVDNVEKASNPTQKGADENFWVWIDGVFSVPEFLRSFEEPQVLLGLATYVY